MNGKRKQGQMEAKEMQDKTSCVQRPPVRLRAATKLAAKQVGGNSRSIWSTRSNQNTRSQEKQTKKAEQHVQRAP
jgi:hypothetical protein